MTYNGIAKYKVGEVVFLRGYKGRITLCKQADIAYFLYDIHFEIGGSAYAIEENKIESRDK